MNSTKKTIKIPYRLRSEANIQEHWAKKHKRRKTQQNLVRLAFNKLENGFLLAPMAITLVRQAPRTLDHDNLLSAFKWIRDAVADQIVPGLQPGRADDKHGLEFYYEQRKPDKPQDYAVIIELEKI